MNQKTIIAILGVAVVILLGTTIYFVTIKNVNQPAPVVKQPTTPVVQQDKQNQQQSNLPIINLNKFSKEEAGKKINHVAVEYQKSIGSDKKTIYEFTYEAVPNLDITYEVSHLSEKYLVVTQCGGLDPCSDYLFDLNKLQQVKLQFPMTLGNILFFENEKYVAFEGIGRVAQPGISIEVIDGKKVYCLISSEEVSDVNINNGMMSFTEYALVEDKDGLGKEVTTKKEINIADFCKNK